MTVFRWIVLIPGAILSWYAALFLGLSALLALDRFCPPEYMVSGKCMTSYAVMAEAALITLFSGVSAIFVVLTSVLIAPTHKILVALVALVVGAIVATVMLISTGFEAWCEFLSAILMGSAASYFTVRRLKLRPAIDA